MDMKGGSAGVPRGLVRQGDLLLVPVAGLPEGADRVGSGRLVLAEGEATGHAHVVDDERASLHTYPWNDTWFLSVEDGEPVLLVHEEHDPLRVLPGAYEVRTWGRNVTPLATMLTERPSSGIGGPFRDRLCTGVLTPPFVAQVSD